MEAGGPPPWLVNMQRYGPPPSYPNLKIQGLNAPIPEGATYGYHPGGIGYSRSGAPERDLTAIQVLGAGGDHAHGKRAHQPLPSDCSWAEAEAVG